MDGIETMPLVSRNEYLIEIYCKIVISDVEKTRSHRDEREGAKKSAQKLLLFTI